jgi:hypothetical protein
MRALGGGQITHMNGVPGDKFRDSDVVLDAGAGPQGLKAVDATIAMLNETRTPADQKRQKGLNNSTAGKP